MHQNFSEIESLPFYELELLVDHLKEKEKQQTESQKSEKDSFKEMQNSYKMPKVNMPKLPKM